MTLVELHYLVSLAEERHFGRAAARCHVSQPALSMAVSQLEKEWGVTLFERSKSGVLVTTSGQQVIAQARKVLASAVAIKSLADSSRNQLNGTLAIGVIPTLAPYLLPALVPQLRMLACELSVRIVEDNTEVLQQKLRSGLLDAVLISHYFRESDILTQDLFEEPLVVMMPVKHALASRQTIWPFDLRGQDFFLLGEGHCLRDQILSIFSSLADIDLPTYINISSSETLRNMVAAGLGVTVAPLSAANSALYAPTALTVRPFAMPAPVRKISLAWRASFPRHKLIDLLRNAVQSCSWQFTTAHENSSRGLLVENSNW